MNNPKIARLVQVVTLVFWSPLTAFWGTVSKYHEPLGVLVAVTATFVAIAAVWCQNKASQDLAKKQNFFQFYQQWESEGMQERRARLAAALLENPNAELIDDSPLVFLETLADATDRDAVDFDLMWTTFYIDSASYWTAAQPYIDRGRRKGCKCFFSKLGVLIPRLNQRAEQEGENPSRVSDSSSVHEFLEWERNRGLTRIEKPNIK